MGKGTLEVGVVTDRGYTGSGLLSRCHPPPTLIRFGAENCVSVGGEVRVPSLISLDKYWLMAARNVRRRHLPEMVTNSLPPADTWGGGGRGQRPEQV